MESFNTEEFSNTLETLEAVSRIENLAGDIRDLNSGQHIPRGILRDFGNPLEALSDKQFQSAHAFSKDKFLHVFDLFKTELQPSNPGRHVVPPLIKFSTFLFYLRSNGFYRYTRFQYYYKLFLKNNFS